MEDVQTRTRKALGEPKEVELAAIAVEARWHVAEPTPQEVADAVKSQALFPIVCREVDGKPVCVAPAEKVRALQVAAEQGMIPGTAEAYVLEGMDDEEADHLREVVAWATHPEASDEWRSRNIANMDGLAAYRGRPWFKVSGTKEFFCAVTGYPTTAVWRNRSLQEQGIPAIRRLHDEGVLSLRTACQYVTVLPAEDQEVIAAALEARKGEPGFNATAVCREAGPERPVEVDKIAHEINVLAKAVARGTVEVPLDKVNLLQYQVSQLFMAVNRR